MEPIKKQNQEKMLEIVLLEVPNLSSESGSPTSVLQTQSGGMPDVATNLRVYTQRKRNVVSSKRMSQGGRNRTNGVSKSVTTLQLEELRGFRDLGFEFTEEDQKNLKLVSIVPGLKRLGQNLEASERLLNDEIHRPYLSESWDVMEKKNEAFRKPALRINLKVGEMGREENETLIKEQIKVWARAVASAIRLR